MREVLKVIAVVVLAVVAGGCASIPSWMGGGGPENIAAALDAGSPGSGDILRQANTVFKTATGQVAAGPFGALPYTTSRQVVLKDGTTITEDKIEKIIEILTPVVPAAIIRTVAPQDYMTITVPTNAPGE